MIFRMPKLHPKAEVATFPLLEPRLVGSHPPSAPAEGQQISLEQGHPQLCDNIVPSCDPSLGKHLSKI